MSKTLATMASQMAKRANPFALDMRTLKAPAGCGDTLSIAGFDIELDADRCVEVPSRFASDLQAHGFTPAPATA